ncbi:MAG: hypothetical protein HKM97_06440 [Acidimicrobiia bacterium]|nr:hypothetical protein [Acidimicrobiia bacterium]NNF88145.1 hypothetical protein [Acidimicrobiia bacterium]NNJ47822.1 hypothetical protein [Acidimicrobiia bacterium]
MKRLLVAPLILIVAACGAGEPGQAVPTAPESSSTTTSTTSSTLPRAAQEELLAQARATWAANRPESYAVTYRLSCECDGGPWIVQVDGEETVLAARVGLEPGAEAPYRSVEAIFDEIEAALEAGLAPVDAAYDPISGYPREYIFNEPELPVDGGFVLEVTDFDPRPAGSVPEQRRILEEALQKWTASDIADYDYSFTRGCFCPEEFVGPYTVSVRAGEIAAASFQGTDLFDIDMLEIGRYEEIAKTVDDVFAEIERALRAADSVTAEYDPVLGYPTDVYIDWIANAADEEIGYTIRNLRDPSRYPDACSTEGWEAELVSQPDLPEPVAATRRALFDAAMSCDFGGIAAVSDAADLPVQTSHGGSGPEYIWQREREGIPLMRTLVEHLNLSYSSSPNERGETYVWPSAMSNLTSPYGDGLPAVEYEALLELYSVEDLEEMFEFFGGFVGYRIVIAADGEWLFSIAGD